MVCLKKKKKKKISWKNDFDHEKYLLKSQYLCASQQGHLDLIGTFTKNYLLKKTFQKNLNFLKM